MRRRKKKYAILSIVSGIIAAASICAAVLINNDAITKIIDLNIYKRNYTDEDASTLEHPYLSETTYDSSNDIDLRVYDYPFYNDVGEYLSNIDLYSSYPEVFESMYSKVKLSTDNFFTSILGTGYRTINENEDSFTESLMSVITEDSIHGMSSDEYVSDIKEFISSAEYQGSATFESDTSLIWFSDYGYIRGVLTLDVYNINGETDSDVYADGLEIVDQKKYIVDVSVVVSGDLNTVKISDYKIVADIS